MPAHLSNDSADNSPIRDLLGFYNKYAMRAQILRLHPVSPFGFWRNPGPSPLAALGGAEPAEGDDAGRVWADSMKKRKRKMNKHKHKKLRKCLWRKAKSEFGI
ncbi:hypothetical protein ACJRO7_008382 [Eucalyptus globulus]|uniref:Mitochondrial mRNA-processing protein COX24 C-terminal domain-containing protein n=1 Tax=Eucalyptus globulus TaxID=34317 RepID=A0ABD3IRR9_EUCGL